MRKNLIILLTFLSVQSCCTKQECKQMFGYNFKIKSIGSKLTVNILNKEMLLERSTNLNSYDTLTDGAYKFEFPNNPKDFTYVIISENEIDTVKNLNYQYDKKRIVCNTCFIRKDQYFEYLSFHNHSYELNNSTFYSDLIILRK